jgi:hypothetical protein
MRAIVILGLAAALLATPAFAKDATCYTSDDGEYPCSFQSLDGAGSFEISARGKPTFQVWIDSPGVASVGATFEAGGRSVALPGTYYRSEDDGACWVSDATDTEICAW